MANPWLDIPLADYEGHMSLTEVGQAQLLSDLFAEALTGFAPRVIVVVGCSGGNGFERISPRLARRVIGIDINPEYIDRTRERFGGRLPGLELHLGDIQTDSFPMEPADLVFAGLVFEYVDPAVTMERIRPMLAPAGILATVIQLADADRAPITPSLFTTLQLLAPVMRLVTPEELRASAAAAGFCEAGSRRVRTAGGKHLQYQTFRIAPR